MIRSDIQSTKGRLVTLQSPMPDDLDGIVDSVRSILLKGEIQKLTLSMGEPIVYQRFVRPDEEVPVGESTSSFAELTLMDVVRNTHMEEFDTVEEGSGSPYQQILQMFLRLSEDGWVVTHLLTGERTRFWKWLGITAPQKRRLCQFLGARIETELTLPEDVFILCGSGSRGACIAEICCSLKGNIK